MSNNSNTFPVPEIDWMRAACDYSPFGWNTIYYACVCGGLTEHLAEVGETCWIGCLVCGAGEEERISPSDDEPGDGIWLRSERPGQRMWGPT